MKSPKNLPESGLKGIASNDSMTRAKLDIYMSIEGLDEYIFNDSIYRDALNVKSMGDVQFQKQLTLSYSFMLLFRPILTFI